MKAKLLIPLLILSLCSLDLSARCYVGGSFAIGAGLNQIHSGYSMYIHDNGTWMNSLSFGLSGQTDDVIDTLSQIAIGFYYKF